MTMTEKTNIIIADADAAVRAQLARVLMKAGYNVFTASDAQTAGSLVAQALPQSALLMADAFLAQKLLAADGAFTLPVIVLSAREQETEKIALLEQGAADYIRKPLMEDEEILARVKAVLRGFDAPEEPRQGAYVRNGLRVDLHRRHVALYERRVHLTPTEYDLLEQLILRDGRIVSQARLMREVWGQSGRGRGHYLRIYIQRLRQKLGDDPFRPKYIVTETGIGYRLMENEHATMEAGGIRA